MYVDFETLFQRAYSLYTLKNRKIITFVIYAILKNSSAKQPVEIHM